MSASEDGHLVKVAQRALEAADRRRKLASKLCGDGDKRPRPHGTSSTKVTPDGKKSCSRTSLSSDEPMIPRQLSFSADDDQGDAVPSSGVGSTLGPASEPVKIAALPAKMRAPATPQTARNSSSSNSIPHAAPVAPGTKDDHITYKPVTADAVNAFFNGIPKKVKSEPSLVKSEPSLVPPPPDQVLQTPPLPQILPSEIQASAQENQDDYTKRQDELLQILGEMDDVELKKCAAGCRAHPLFQQYCSALACPECPNPAEVFGSELSVMAEECCDFALWVEALGASDFEQQAQALATYETLPQPTTDTAPAAESTPTVVTPKQPAPTVVQPDTAPAAESTPAVVTPEQPAPTVAQPEEATNPMDVTGVVATQPEQHEQTTTSPTESKATAVVVVGDTPPQVWPDNQLGDPTLYPDTPVPATPVIVQSCAKTLACTPTTPEPSACEFMPITSEGVKAFWSALRRKSTDSLPDTPSLEVPVPPVPVPQVLGARSSGSEASATPVSPAPAEVATPAPTTAPMPENQTSPSPSTAPGATAQAPAQTPPPAPTPELSQASPAPSTTPRASPTPSPLAEAEAAAAQELAAPSADDIKEARACYMRFYRSVRSPKAPDAVSKKFVEASADPSGRLMRVLFSEYLECSENWLASQLVLNETSSQNDVTGGKFSWMTKADLMARYHQNGAIVQELINGKMVSGQCKDHPEFPGNADMKLYRCWVEDYEVNESRHSRSVSHIREAEGSYGYKSTPRLDQQQGNGNGRGGNGAIPKPKPKPKAKKEKSEDQLSRAAVVKVNANLLEISTWQYKLQAAGVAPVVATAFVDQMKDEAENLRKAKAALESALASGTATEQARKALDDANELYKANSVTIRKHTQPAKPKTKAKAKATAAAQAATS